MTGAEKAKIIIDAYQKRNFTQAQLAAKYNISESDIRKTLQLSNYEHTIHRNSSNLRDGQSYRPIIFDQDFNFLDKYDDTLFFD